jgi:hypothetical protein
MDRLTDDAIDFKDFEEWCYGMGMAYARMLMYTGLSGIDDRILKERDKTVYRAKDKRRLILKTLMGEVEIWRRLYKTKSDKGDDCYVYLLDQMIGMDTVGKITVNLVRRMADMICESPYRSTASAISFGSGQSISHGGVWNVISKAGDVIEDIDESRASAVKAFKHSGTKVVKVLQEEFDGVWVNMQGKDRPKSGRKAEMKLASSYEGVELTGKDKRGHFTYDTVNPLFMAGFEDADEFFAKKEGQIGSVYDLDEIEVRLTNGDGGSWVQGFANRVSGESHTQLDPFHIKKEIRRSGIEKEKQKKIENLIDDKKIDVMLRYAGLLLRHEEDVKKRKRLGDMYKYFANNADIMVPIKERGIDLPKPSGGIMYGNMGTMEGTVCNLVALRMKHRKASFTKEGATNLARLICLKRSGILDDTISKMSSMILPMSFEEMVTMELSAAKAPKKDGKGYHYPVNGDIPFIGEFITNGRRAVKGMTDYRSFTEMAFK